MSVIVSCFNCFLLLLSCQFQVELPTYKKKVRVGVEAATGTRTHKLRVYFL